MLSEGIHSLVDTGNQGLLLFGLRQAKKPPSPEFPFGHGKEIYFWSFVVAMLIFALGGTLSLYQGYVHLFDAKPIEQIFINYVVLGLAVVFESGALWVALKEFNASRGELGVFEAIKQGKDPTLFVVVLEDSAAMAGLLIALVGLVLYQVTGNTIFDALASMAIGVVLIVTAFSLAIESKNLLIGESAEPRVVAQIHEIFEDDPLILHTNEVVTLHMGPDAIIVAMSVDFADGIAAEHLETTVTKLNAKVKAVDPRILRVFIEAEGQRNHPSDSTQTALS